MDEPRAACTVVTRADLPAARVLARSYLDHHPDDRFVVAVTDGIDGLPAADGYELVGADWFDVDRTDYLRMATAYTAKELVGAVKPLLLRRLLAEHPVVLFLQATTRVLAPFPEVTKLAEDEDIVLVPRLLQPLPRDGKDPNETAVMAMGMFDLGFLAVSRGAKPFLDFWAERLRHDAVIDPGIQLFADQRWADQVPALFRHTVLRDPGFAVGYWNAHERPLAEAGDGTFTAAGRPLRFFRFDGFRADEPWLLSHDCSGRPRVVLSEHPALRRLCSSYRDALLAAGYRPPSDAGEYGFDTLPDGTELTIPLRRLFRNAWIEAERTDAKQFSFRRATTTVPPHPFGADGGAGFRQWLSEPSSPPEQASGLNRFTMLVWSHRGDLQRAFPWPCAADAPAFRQWCRTYGVREKMLPRWALPREPEPLRAPDDEFGVNLAGYLTAELGLGEMGRIVHNVLRHAAIPVSSVVEEYSLACRTDLSRPDTVGRPRFPVSVMSVNSDQTELLLASYPEVGHDRYRIGLWAWELEEVPKWQQEGFPYVDEVWTVSEFCRDAFAKHSSVPVKVIPVPVLDPGPVRRPPRRPGRPVRFFFAFDFNSTGQRKNPWGAVTAFQRAFPGRDDVRLVIKATNGNLHAKAAERLRLAIGDDPRIELMERYLSVEELNDLYANSDCYVSLHRSEGFGLTVAEAMARGLAVISTDYSSTTEFFDSTVGWPIPYRRVKVGEGWFPYQAEATWADPDLDAAARAMREIADHPDEAARRGEAAREYILRSRSMDAAAEWMRTELRNAYQTWRSRRNAGEGTGDPVTTAPRPLDRAREALRWRAEADAPSRTPLAPALRRAVLRVIDHYDVHQRRVMAAVVDSAQQALDQLAGRLDRSADEQARKVDAVESRTNHRIGELADRLARVERSLDGLARRDLASLDAKRADRFVDHNGERTIG